MGINNDVYDRLAGDWWDEGGSSTITSIRFLVHPARASYIKNVLEMNPPLKGGNVLDLGCGGGYMAEELARGGYRVTGIDPSEKSIEAAGKHASETGLSINYRTGYGEDLPFDDNSFDIVCCCDTLEHVRNLDKVISEISRVLVKDGIFLYDTVNRTIVSRIAVIKVMQEWKGTSFVEAGVHEWNRFIKPQELLRLMDEHDLVSREMKGITPGMNLIGHYFSLRKAKQGKISYRELGSRIQLHVGGPLACAYIGYAVKSRIHYVW